MLSLKSPSCILLIVSVFELADIDMALELIKLAPPATLITPHPSSYAVIEAIASPQRDNAPP